MANTNQTQWVYKKRKKRNELKLRELVDGKMKKIGGVNGDTHNGILLNACMRLSNISCKNTSLKYGKTLLLSSASMLDCSPSPLIVIVLNDFL